MLAGAPLFINMALRPLTYRLNPVLPEANSAETRYPANQIVRVPYLSDLFSRIETNN